jgi:queuine tRNA-ribosyltransferase
MPLQFDIYGSDGPGRLGEIRTAHGAIQTPVFMPVGTLATVKGVPQSVLEELSAQIILANTYHLYLRPGHERVRQLGGVHRFMSWGRSMLTDSGGFQVFSLSELRKVNEEGVTFRSHLDGSSHMFTPERSMEIQIALGADIMMCFDECLEYPAEKDRVRASMEMTLRWARRSKEYFEAHKDEVPWDAGRPAGTPVVTTAADGGATGRGADGGAAQTRVSATPNSNDPDPYAPIGAAQTQSLFGIVQGGMYKDLRRESALRTVELDFPGYAIGGLSVGEPREATRDIIESTLEHLPKNKPRYVMGVGYPDEIVEYAAMGVDMMDCVLPTRAARHGLLFTSEGRMNIKNVRYAEDTNPPDVLCRCMVCARYTRAYLRHLFTTGESLGAVLNSIHNLAFYLDTMSSVRDAIRNRELSKLISTRVTS